MLPKAVLFTFLGIGLIAQSVNGHLYESDKTKESCYKNNPNAAAGFMKLNQCSNTLSPSIISIAESNVPAAEVTKIICTQTSEAKTCFKSLIDALTPCLNSDESEELNYLKILFDRALDYSCRDYGKAIKEFIQEDGVKCIKSKSTELNQCIYENIVAKKLPINKKNVGAVFECIETKMASCPHSAHAALHNMFDYVQNDAALPVITSACMLPIFVLSFARALWFF